MKPRVFRIIYQHKGDEFIVRTSHYDTEGKNGLKWAIEEADSLCKFKDYMIEEYDEEDDTWYTMVLDGAVIFPKLLD